MLVRTVSRLRFPSCGGKPWLETMLPDFAVMRCLQRDGLFANRRNIHIRGFCLGLARFFVAHNGKTLHCFPNIVQQICVQICTFTTGQARACLAAVRPDLASESPFHYADGSDNAQCSHPFSDVLTGQSILLPDSQTPPFLSPA